MSTELALTIAQPLLAFLLIAGLAYGGARSVGGASVRAWFVLLAAGALLTPWLVPSSMRFVRFVVAVYAVLLVLRLWETAVGRGVSLRSARRSPQRYFYYLFSPGEVDFSATDDGARRATRFAGVRRGLRGLLKAALVAGLLWAKHAPSCRVWSVLDISWWLVFSYLAASLVADLVTALGMVLTGYPSTELFNAPPLATSPPDFWGRRWNLTFRNTAHRLVFLPLRRHVGVGGGVALVFVFSALVHEYAVFAALGAQLGWMTGFFLLQGAAVLLVSKRPGWRARVPRLLGMVLHISWMLLTSPLFFRPIKSIVNPGPLFAYLFA